MTDVVVALDVGGMSIKRGVVNLTASDGPSVELADPQVIDATLPKQELLDVLGTAIEPLLGAQVSTALGIAFPGPMDYVSGIPAMRGQRKFDSLYGVNLRTWIAETWPERDLEVRFVNDAAAAALGEDLAGAATTSRSSVTITLGTGFGAAAVIDGQSAEYVGSIHVPMLFELPVDGGRADDLLSAVGLAQRIGVEPEQLAAASQAARQGDAELRSRFDAFGLLLGRFLTATFGDTEIDTIVVGGGASRSFDLFGGALVDAVDADGQIDVRPAELGQRAPLLGVASSWLRA